MQPNNKRVERRTKNGRKIRTYVGQPLRLTIGVPPTALEQELRDIWHGKGDKGIWSKKKLRERLRMRSRR